MGGCENCSFKRIQEAGEEWVSRYPEKAYQQANVVPHEQRKTLRWNRFLYDRFCTETECDKPAVDPEDCPVKILINRTTEMMTINEIMTFSDGTTITPDMDEILENESRKKISMQARLEAYQGHERMAAQTAEAERRQNAPTDDTEEEAAPTAKKNDNRQSSQGDGSDGYI